MKAVTDLLKEQIRQESGVHSGGGKTLKLKLHMEYSIKYKTVSQIINK